MTIDGKIKDWKLQYDIKREPEKMLALSYGKFDKYKFPSDQEILPSNQREIIEQKCLNISL